MANRRFLNNQEIEIFCPFNGINDGISATFPNLLRILVSATPGEVTNLLLELKRGNREAEGLLIPLVYRELRRIAARYLRRESPGHSLQATALVHEAYIRLIDIREVDWQSRSHFFAVSATLMRRILVDHARASQARKRGNGWDAVSLNEAILPSPERAPEILALDEALNKLASFDERQSKIVELRFFAGMSENEAGNVLGISPRTVKRDWRIAKAWLFKELNC
jgi:RNA polymerase sigma factor (TIGR02999 family)